MPYAPGNTYRAGDYFAAMGPRINDNIQTYLRNREERQQTTATAEMLGRYLGQDPQAMEMFGDKLAQVPSMSSGAAKGVIGGVATYMAQRHLQAVEDTQKQSSDLARKQYELQAGAAAQRLAQDQRLGQFNEMVGKAMSPEGTGITADTLARFAAQSGVLGEPGINSLITAAQNYSQRAPGMPLGSVQDLPGGHQIIGLGPGITPHFQPAEKLLPTKGLDFGATQETPEGTLVGMGLNNEPKFIAVADKSKPTPIDQGFMMFSPVFAHQLDAAEAAIDKYGRGLTGGAPGTDPVGRATLQQLPTLLASSYAKVTDPSGVVRDSDIKIFTDRLFPQGLATRADVTKAAIENLRNDLVMRVAAWGANQKDKGKVPGGMPDWVGARLKASPDSQSSAAATVAVISKDGKRGTIPASQLADALKEGYRRAE